MSVSCTNLNYNLNFKKKLYEEKKFIVQCIISSIALLVKAVHELKRNDPNFIFNFNKHMILPIYQVDIV